MKKLLVLATACVIGFSSASASVSTDASYTSVASMELKKDDEQKALKKRKRALNERARDLRDDEKTLKKKIKLNKKENRLNKRDKKLAKKEQKANK